MFSEDMTSHWLFKTCSFFYYYLQKGKIKYENYMPDCHLISDNKILTLHFKKKKKKSPLTARRSNQSILKEISLEYSLKGLMLKLKLQYFTHLMQRTD